MLLRRAATQRLRLLPLVLASSSLGVGVASVTSCLDYGDSASSNCNETTALTCTSCHGDPGVANSAPPRDVTGQTATTEITVGAHQAHLQPSAWHRTVACDECHVVPSGINALGHIDTSPAELAFGPLAFTDDATPQWDRAAATCEGVYCHGATVGGGTHASPLWTQVDGSQSACGACHSLPPPAPHNPSTACADCHGNVVDADNDFVDPSLHINGRVDLAPTGCGLCHGNATNNAPPTDTQGRSDTTLITVGAHQAHLTPAPWRRTLECDDCHVVPASWDDPGHLDARPAEVTFGALAKVGDTLPRFYRSATTCVDVYCHGVTLSWPIAGGSVNRRPEWTVVDGTYSECGTSCHTLPPGGHSPSATQCQACHGSSITSFNASDPASSTWASPSRHIDGTLDF